MKEDLALLEKYVEGKMTARERAEFEKALVQDNDLINELKKYLLSKTAIEHASNERIKRQLDEIGTTLEQRHSQKTRWVTILLAAAGIALLIGLGWVMKRSFQHPRTHEEIFLSYYQRPGVYEMEYRGSGSDSSILIWNRAINCYASGEIQKAITEFEYLSSLPDLAFSSGVYFFLGISYLESDKPEKAIQAFKQVSTGSRYNLETQFYRALCLIKLDKQKDAADLLYTIKNNHGHPYRKKASKILKEL